MCGCRLLLASCSRSHWGSTAYRAGKSHNARKSAHATSGNADARIEALEQRISDAGHEREILRAQLAERDKVIAELRRQTEQQARSLDEMKSAQANLEQSLQTDDAEKQRVTDERASLAQKFDELRRRCRRCNRNSIRRTRQRAQDAGPGRQPAEPDHRIFPANFASKSRRSAKQDELLSHDRDIRELMGARDLYVAEVYDVGADGTTQKSYRARILYQGQIADLLRL